jgi:hypothetical protein
VFAVPIVTICFLGLLFGFMIHPEVLNDLPTAIIMVNGQDAVFTQGLPLPRKKKKRQMSADIDYWWLNREVSVSGD